MPVHTEQTNSIAVTPIHAPSWRIAVVGNIKDEHQELPAGVPPDAFADFDHKETMDRIEEALQSDGHKTTFFLADGNLPAQILSYKPDLVFNMAEGQGGDAREAQVPALLEMLHIPYTASRVLTNAISLDKTLTKRIWRDRHLPVAPFQEFLIGDEPLRPDMTFPLFVKPAREGTGMGVDARAIVHDVPELRKRVQYVIDMYSQPALVEAYLPGREFTVGILGRQDAVRFSRHPGWYDKDGFHRFPLLEIGVAGAPQPTAYGHEFKSMDLDDKGQLDFYCPAKVEPDLARKLESLALRAHLRLGALDISRTDIRLDAAGNPRLIEINTLPGLTPGYSDLCLQSQAEGIEYRDLILEILYLAAGRWGLLPPRPA